MQVKTAIFISAILFSIQLNAQLGTGALFDPHYKSSLKKASAGSLGYAGDLPSSYSMKMYTPYAKNQGQYGTCVGWATAYSALTTEFAKSIGLTNRNMITGLSFCPYFLYNEVTSDNTCEQGMDATDAILYLMDHGDKKFYLPVIGCGSSVNDAVMDDALHYKIKNGYVIYNPDGGWDDAITDPVAQLTKYLTEKSKPDFQTIKEVLASGDPVIYTSFIPMSYFAVKSDSWEPTAEEKLDPGKYVLDNTGMHQKHAMCIIGYDDDKNGGSFEILNSWGQSWGDNGFTWIKYDDWALFAYGAYYLELEDPDMNTINGTGCISGDCNNGYGEYKFGDDSRFVGHFKNSVYDGEGIYAWANGQVYAGDWVEGKRNGEGTQYIADGTYGSCEYTNDDQTSGYAEWKYNNGDKYDGNLNATQQRSGYGMLKFANGDEYDGDWENDTRSGMGTMHWANGDEYYGEWSENDMNGMGILIKSDGNILAGSFSYGQFKGGHNGYGYAGEKISGALNKIISTPPQRAYQTADCETGDCIYGKGHRKYSNGMNYDGEFKDGVEDGSGTMYLSDSSIYVGNFKQGKFSGAGRWEYPDGTRVIVMNLNEKPDGYAMVYDTNGNIMVQYYANGEFVRNVTDWISTATTLNYAGTYGTNPKATRAVQMPKK